jgi:membrane-associated phospholipid phosphatase
LHHRRAAWAALVVSVALFGVLAWAAHGSPGAVDTTLLRALRVGDRGAAHAAMNFLVVRLTDLGAPAVGVVVGSWLLVRRRLVDLLVYLACVGGALALIPLLKSEFHRESLTVANDHSFPSGHAIGSLAVSLPLLALLQGRARVAAAVLVPVYAVAVGVALVALRIHYPTDVAAGWCAATAWITAVLLRVR